MPLSDKRKQDVKNGAKFVYKKLQKEAKLQNDPITKPQLIEKVITGFMLAFEGLEEEEYKKAEEIIRVTLSD